MDYEHELYHYGILGMKWGIRRYQNPDGSLTAEGRKRYGVESSNKVDISKKSIMKSFKEYHYDDHYALKDIRSKLPKDKIGEIDKIANEINDRIISDALDTYKKLDVLEKDRAFAKELESKMESMSFKDITDMLGRYDKYWKSYFVDEAFVNLSEDVAFEHITGDLSKYYSQKHKEKVKELESQIDSIADSLASEYVSRYGDSPLPDKCKRGVNREASNFSDIIRNAARYCEDYEFWDPPYSKDYLETDLYYFFSDKEKPYKYAFSDEFKSQFIKKLEQIPDLKR